MKWVVGWQAAKAAELGSEPITAMKNTRGALMFYMRKSLSGGVDMQRVWFIVWPSEWNRNFLRSLGFADE